ncbi:TIR domain-containing protein [Rhodopseudomonas faecalis]|uniref:TIR domain-containing protein n=1 Tax=Rhodopseudomonas faecalis TaxID=99655 RepID=A0A318TH20_9BRAD|nr:toll/interleukin-1 receptor domain-containing protein [Rhodopseudomonas faecalis]PYF03813.1 TIR domain-containing protein [Rhodopseudomonas faecalis]
MPEDHKRVFISYARQDRDFARQIGDLMIQRGVAVAGNLDASFGSDWRDGLRRQIESANALVLLIPSQTEPNRNAIWFEAGAAKALGKPVLAVLPPSREAATTELPTDLAGLLMLDANRRSLDSVADTLVQAVPARDLYNIAAH